MNMKKLLKMFGHKHKWIYAKLLDARTQGGQKPTSIRFCKCGMVEYRKLWHMTSDIWSGAIVYTDKGAEAEVDGYNE